MISLLNKYKSVVRVVSFKILLAILCNILFPTVSLALTSGPIAPEYSDFEPADATENVNLLTGNFTYNMALMHVPGPEGGYPISMSYHAGITMDQEASWVGLGWSLNEGAINRSVSMVPDDVTNYSRKLDQFWEGGELTEEYSSFYINLEVKGVGLSLNYHTYESNDTYDGKKTGTAFGVDVSIPIPPASLNVGATVGFGELSKMSGGSVGMSVGYGALSVGFDVAVNGTGVTTTMYASANGITAYTQNSLDGEYNSAGVSLPYSASSKTTASTNIINGLTESSYEENSSVNLGIVGWQYSKVYTRYWSDNSGEEKFSGCISTINESFDDVKTFRKYNENVGINDAADTNGGSAASYDQYTMVAQGLLGSIQPYSTQSYPNKGKKVFRNIGEYTRSLAFGSSNMASTGKGENFSGVYDIKYFTNLEIFTGDALQNYGFITDGKQNYQRFINDQRRNAIGGFMVRKSNGFTYYYAQPVYLRDEYTVSFFPDEQNKMYSFANQNKEDYAYSWLLTGITGPDYIDRDRSGTVSDEDWGYWVAFDYGKWTNDHHFRSPHTGENIDIKSNTKTIQGGTKELYYLDAIRTRTHTALFVKDLRRDGHGVVKDLLYTENGNIKPFWNRNYYTFKKKGKDCGLFSSKLSFINEPIFGIPKIEGVYVPTGNDLVNYVKNYRVGQDKDHCTITDILLKQRTNKPDDEEEGGELKDIIRNADPFFDKGLLGDGGSTPRSVRYLKNGQLLTQMSYPTSTLKLDKILLIENELLEYCTQFKSLSEIKETGDKYDLGFTSEKSKELHLHENVLDITDDYLTSIERNSIQTVSFEYNYSLCRKVLNNLPNNNLTYSTSPTYNPENATATDLTGKLTLLSVTNGGLGGRSLIPPTRFDYHQYSSSENPNYEQDKYDLWGSYKTFDGTTNYSNENAKRKSNPTTVDTDVAAWSLKEVLSPMGTKTIINYESDVINKKILDNFYTFELAKGSILSTNIVNGNTVINDVLLEFAENNVDQHIQVNDWIVPELLLTYEQPQSVFANEGITRFTNTAKVTGVGSNYVTLNLNKNIDGVTNTSLISKCASNFSTNILYGRIKKQIPGNSLFAIKGGGIRVKSLKNIPFNGRSVELLYSYSEGTVAFEPFYLTNPPNTIPNPNNNSTLGFIISFAKKGYEKYKASIYRKITENPNGNLGLRVMYGKVSVQTILRETFADGEDKDNTNINLPGKVEYTYNLPQPFGMTGGSNSDIDYTPVRYGANSVEIDNFTPRIGSLSKIETFDVNNNPLNHVKYIYAHDKFRNSSSMLSNASIKARLASDFSNIGVLEQVSTHPASVRTKNSEYPDPLIEVESKDYKTGIVNMEYTKEYDYFTGMPRKSIFTDANKNTFLREYTPLYETNPDLAISNGKNLYNLPKSDITYKIKSVDEWKLNSDKLGIVSSTKYNYEQFQTPFIPVFDPYKDAPNPYPDDVRSITRLKSVEVLVGKESERNPDGTYKISQLSSDDYKKTVEHTLYDIYSHLMEAKDINGNASCLLYNPEHKLVLASVRNSTYREAAYSGCEFNTRQEGYSEGNVENGEGIVIKPTWGNGHTGLRCLLVEGNKKGFNFKIPSPSLTKTYRASVWVYVPNETSVTREQPKLQASSTANFSSILLEAKINPIKKAGSWYLMELDNVSAVSGSDLYFRVYNNGTSTAVYFDDFRVHPSNASMIANVYDPVNFRQTHTLNANNMYVRNEVDAIYRPRKAYVETFGTVEKLVAEQRYHIKK